MHELYERIMKEANKNKINGKQLGELLGLRKSPLTDWKNDQSIPTTEQLIKLCDIFAVSADYLLFGSAHRLSNEEIDFISNYRLLSKEDKEELIEILQIKLRKAQNQKRAIVESSPLVSNDKSNIVC